MGLSSERLALRGLALAAIALCLTYGAIRGYSALWEPAADLGVTFDSETLRFVSLRPAGAAERAGLEPHDWLLAIDGRKIATHLEVHDIVRRHAPGDSLRVEVSLAALNQPRTYEVVLDRRTPSGPESWLGRAARAVDASVPLLLIAATGALVLTRPERHECWLLLLVAAGAAATLPLLAFLERVPPGARAFAVAFKILAAAVGPAALHYLLSIFPEPSDLDRLEPRAKSAALVGSLAIAAPFAAWGARTSGVALLGSSWAAAGRWSAGAYWTLALAAGGYALWDCAAHARSNDSRRRASIVGVGALVALVPAVLLALAQFPAALPLLVLPPVWAYVLTARQPLPVATLAGRCVRALTLGPAAVLPLGASCVLVALVLADFVGIVPGLLGGLVLGGAVLYIHRRYRDTIEQRLFPRAWEARRSLDALPAALSGAASPSEVLSLLERELALAFDPSSIALYLATESGCLEVRTGKVPRGTERLRLDEPIPGLDGPKLAALAAAARIGPDCIAPLVASGAEVAGLIVLGGRRSQAPYTEEELGALSRIGGHGGAALGRLRQARVHPPRRRRNPAVRNRRFSARAPAPRSRRRR